MAPSGDCGLSISDHVILRTKRLCYSTSHTLDMDLLLTSHFQLFEIGKVTQGKLLDMLNIPSNPNIGRIRIPAVLAKVACAITQV